MLIIQLVWDPEGLKIHGLLALPKNPKAPGHLRSPYLLKTDHFFSQRNCSSHAEIALRFDYFQVKSSHKGDLNLESRLCLQFHERIVWIAYQELQPSIVETATVESMETMLDCLKTISISPAVWVTWTVYIRNLFLISNISILKQVTLWNRGGCTQRCHQDTWPHVMLWYEMTDQLRNHPHAAASWAIWKCFWTHTNQHVDINNHHRISIIRDDYSKRWTNNQGNSR